MSEPINKLNIPKHIAITMDGNGRWAKERGKKRVFGHNNGVKSVRDTIEGAVEYGVKFLTLFAFSTENWKRPKTEINYLFNLLENFIKKRIIKFNKNNIKLKIIGIKKFSPKLNTLLIESEKKTKNNNKLQINLALNYGSKNEIIYAIKKLINLKKNINEKNISKCLFTENIPDPDLLIRTGNTHRLSNFLLWQIAYSEIFFEQKLWPDFNEKDYNKILNKFKNIKRNFGNI